MATLRDFESHGGKALPIDLLQLLSNSLILCHTAPYLSVADTLRLSAASRTLRWLVQQSPQVFRRLDLTTVKSAQFDIDGIDHGGNTWRNVQLDENLTEDDFYSGPLRGIFSSLRRRNVLAHVQTLILDGLSVTSDLVHDIIANPQDQFSVKILSLREVRNLNEGKLAQALSYACRPGRPKGTPRVKGVYLFGPSEATRRKNAEGRSTWVDCSGGTDPEPVEEEEAPSAANWYATDPVGGPVSGAGYNANVRLAMLAYCAKLIAFDAVLCTSPRHAMSSVVSSATSPTAAHAAGLTYSAVEIATYALGACAGCGSATEDWTEWDVRRAGSVSRSARRSDAEDGHAEGPWEVGRFPLLSPPPLHSSSVKAAMWPPEHAFRAERCRDREEKQHGPRFIPRCWGCIASRYCTRCRRWWCERCLPDPQVERVDVVQSAQSVSDTVAKYGLGGSAAGTEGAWPIVQICGHSWNGRGVCRGDCAVLDLHETLMRDGWSPTFELP